MIIKNSFGIALVVIISVVVSACGSTTSTSSTTTTMPAPMTQLQNKTPTTSAVAAGPNGQLIFVPKALSVKAGSNTFVFNNSSAVDHLNRPGSPWI